MDINLAEICKMHNITLAELGRRIGKSRQYMSELARGNIRLTYEMATKIALALDTTPDNLFMPNKSNYHGLNTGTEG